MLIEIRRSPAPTWASVLANDVLELRRVQVVGSANGTQSVLWLRRAPRSWLLVEVFSHEPEDDDVAEIEHAVRSIAAAAGATVEVLDEGPVARD
ncbi:MAG: hypothetical protein ACAI25_15460 [Planctomycetota bacterium]